MDLQICKVILSKEISWEKVPKLSNLYVDMMRNRVCLKAEAKYAPVQVHSYSEIMWGDFVKETRRYLDAKNVGLYSFDTEETLFDDGKKIHFTSGYGTNHANRSEGQITIYFEDGGDYARYLKERAVNFKLSINTQ